MSLQELFDGAAASLHEAALDDEHWPTAARLINEVTGTEGNALACGTGRFQAEIQFFFMRLFFRRQDSADWSRYLQKYWYRDECVPRVAALPYGQLAHTVDLYTDREKKTSPAYNEARRKARMQHGLNVRLKGPGGSQVHWSLADSIDADGWTTTQIEAIQHLMPHMRQFVCVRQALADAGALGSTLSGLLDDSRLGVFQLDRHGRIAEANDRALGQLRQGDPLCDSAGFLRARNPRVDARLQCLLELALPPFGIAPAGGSMTIRRRSRRSNLRVHINPVPGHERDFLSQRIAVLVLVADPEQSPQIDQSHVAATFGLSPAESRVAVMLAAGQSIREISAATSRTEGTVRWHLKRIFRKLGISRQAELVQRVLSLDGLPGFGD